MHHKNILSFQNNLEARLHDLESKQNSYRQEPRRDDRYARNQDSRASYTERRQDIARGRVPVDQRINVSCDLFKMLTYL